MATGRRLPSLGDVFLREADSDDTVPGLSVQDPPVAAVDSTRRPIPDAVDSFEDDDFEEDGFEPV
jgi:hypothetical protein